MENKKDETKLNIMVVDDSKVLRRTLKKHINSLGHLVLCSASTAKEAVDNYFEFEPDLVTMDIEMPGGNGIIALRSIMKMDKKAKVIMITSHGEESLIMDSIEEGAIGYVLKPITKEKLEEQFEKVLKGIEDV
ncbi:MAG: response regulator [Campylobacterota bacterium]|nr:response regulator [Campylobacterota bacterium]